jgi:peptide/nickel transport system substrate-binding protein
VPTPSVARGGTLRLGMGITFFGMDPQQEYTPNTWELFRCCMLRTLLSYNGMSSNKGGSQPRPDLAGGPPQISTDGLTWTFHLRRGLRYAPPLSKTEITAGDIVRALLRAGDPETGNEVLAAQYLSTIQGFADYQAGRASTISGLETPDRYTLRIHQTTPDGSLAYALALPMAAPIPPSPVGPGARYGVADGHEWNGDFDDPKGYGQFLVASGPYMFEGAAALDFSTPAGEQRPVGGFTTARLKDFEIRTPGSMTLVRNPSWNPATDPLRPAFADRMEIRIADSDDLFTRLEDGTIDMVFDTPPPAALLHRYQKSDALRSLIETTDGLGEVFATFNVAQPPFDDLAVRRAVSFALDRTAVLHAVQRSGLVLFGHQPAEVAKHFAPDPTEESLLLDWDPYPSAGSGGDLTAARDELGRSRYAKHGRCAAQMCRGVEVLVHPEFASLRPFILRALEALGIRPRVTVTDDFDDRCADPREHIGMCVGRQWFADVPDGGNFLTIFFHSGEKLNDSFVGSTTAQLRNWGYGVRRVPNADDALDRCVDQIGHARFRCWAEVDQMLMTEVVPAVPLVFFQPVRAISPNIRGFSWDQAYVQPALDRIVVAAGSSGSSS